jgi:hypothetical protein
MISKATTQARLESTRKIAARFMTLTLRLMPDRLTLDNERKPRARSHRLDRLRNDRIRFQE